LKRKSLLLRGLVVAAIPAVLFVPAVALFTICPPNYAVFVLAFIWSFSHVLARPFLGWMNASAVVGLLLSLIVLAGASVGFIAPVLARPAGY
jgi:hypothetical protein